MYNSVADIRKNVFTEITRPAYEDGDHASSIEELPLRIVPGGHVTCCDSTFLERAIVGERLRLGIGLPVGRMDKYSSLGDGTEGSAIAEKYYDDPLVNVIKFAYSACPEKTVAVTDTRQGCLAHPCERVCPKDAISMINGESHVDQERCIKYGRCMDACPCGAVSKPERPYARSRGIDAITFDELGQVEVDYDECVSYSTCLVNCPLGAVVDKGQIFQTIHAMKSDKEMIAATAPAFVGRSGSAVTPGKIKGALEELGPTDIVGVIISVDFCTVEEAENLLSKIPTEQPFMATSYCPAWSAMARKLFSDLKPYISMASIPMVLTGWLIRKREPGAKIVFTGPCTAKKLEASRKSVRSGVDFVLTFEEVTGMFEAKGVSLPQAEADTPFGEGTANGRGFAVSGGVANVMKQYIQKEHLDKEVLIGFAGGLKNCCTMLIMAKAGKGNGYPLEDMAYPGDCVADAGTLQPVIKSSALAKKHINDTEEKPAFKNEYLDNLDLLTRE